MRSAKLLSYSFAMILALLAAAATQPTIPDNWAITDTTDNQTGERRIFAETTASYETPTKQGDGFATFQVSCPLAVSSPLLFWFDLAEPVSTYATAIQLMPWLPDDSPDNVVSVFHESYFVWTKGIGNTSVSPVNSKAFAEFIERFSERTNFKVAVYKPGGADKFEISLKGYKAVREYMAANCVPRSK